MAENDLLKRFLDAGVAFTQMTQRRAEELVNELVRTGEMRAEQAQAMVQELVDKSRQNSERFVDQVRADLRSQAGTFGFATKKEVEALRAEVAFLRASMAAEPQPASKAAASKKAAPVKRAAKKA
jgi:polyhydroxyalkanoate synthesis regulator phasin